FHCALTGHKLDNLAWQSKVSFCVVGKTKVLPDRFGTEYESALIFGVAGEVHGEERQAALVALLEKYCRDYLGEGMRYIQNKEKATRVFRITVDYLSGKARKPS
ncbi:MAG: pyridoxamine 5'-phosphate oxidase family protein, partial [Magnetococcales bacterium]|nr:pyridoxamine 5'-phosphate oxidase family protein [Magnetococcales bacterium]